MFNKYMLHIDKILCINKYIQLSIVENICYFLQTSLLYIIFTIFFITNIFK